VSFSLLADPATASFTSLASASQCVAQFVAWNGHALLASCVSGQASVVKIIPGSPPLVTSMLTNAQCGGAGKITLDDSGNAYVACATTGGVYQISSTGQTTSLVFTGASCVSATWVHFESTTTPPTLYAACAEGLVALPDSGVATTASDCTSPQSVSFVGAG